MSLLENWQKIAYNQNQSQADLQRFWQNYFLLEKGIYEQLLNDPDTEVKGTVKELAEKYNIEVMPMVGFLDGIDDSLKESNNLDEVTEDSEVTIDIDTEKLYMNMVGCNAEWLYTLPEWDNIYDKATRDALYKKEKSSHTIVKAPKVGRNDPCPCGSGKKYKKCCGR
jgi:uncharacterized protein YecA (UPF0149 family)